MSATRNNTGNFPLSQRGRKGDLVFLVILNGAKNLNFNVCACINQNNLLYYVARKCELFKCVRI